jgi:hypothetical protein
MKYETINGTLCWMVKPEPEQPKYDMSSLRDELLPVGAYAVLDMLYDIKTYGDVVYAIDHNNFQGLRMRKKDIKIIKSVLRAHHIEAKVEEARRCK